MKEPRTKRFLRYILAHPGTTTPEMVRALDCVQYELVHRSGERRSKVDGRSTFETVKSLVKRGLVRKVKAGTKVRLYSTIPEIETMHELTDYDF